MLFRQFSIAIAAVLASLATSVAVAQAPVQVEVTYWKRLCNMPYSTAVPKRVTSGTLLLQRGTGPIISVTLGPNPVSVTIPGSDPLTGTLQLETSRIKIVLRTTGAADKIPLGAPTSANGVETFSTSQPDDRNGNINALIELEGAAEFLEQAHGSPLRQLKGRIFDDPGSAPSGVTQFDPPESINIISIAGADDRWESTPLTHEYAHLIMQELAPGGPSGGEHFTERSYPLLPDLAWTEGFAHAFAGVITKPEWNGEPKHRCRPYMSFVEIPARPRLTPEHARYAQYNETRVAAVTYYLIDHLGGGVPGFKRLLDGMKQYKRDNHPAHTARDLRDLAVSEFQTSAADQTAIDTIFAMQGMSWEQGFHFGIGEGEWVGGKFVDDEVQLVVTGPNGFKCQASHDIDLASSTGLDDGGLALGEKVADGGISYSTSDDCYLQSGDGVAGNSKEPHTFGTDGVRIPFPYLSGLQHWTGPYIVKAKYVCELKPGQRRFGARCPDTIKLQLSFNNPWLLANVPSFRETIPVTLVKNTEMEIVTFKANGDCKTWGGVDCGF